MSSDPVIFDLAQQYCDEIRAALTKPGIHEDAKAFTVTTDPLLIPKVIDNGVVCITPPDLTFDTFPQFDGSWSIVVLVGPQQLLDVAFKRLARVIEVIRTETTLPISSGTPDSYTPPQGQGAYAGYLLTFTHSYTTEETP